MLCLSLAWGFAYLGDARECLGAQAGLPSLQQADNASHWEQRPQQQLEKEDGDGEPAGAPQPFCPSPFPHSLGQVWSLGQGQSLTEGPHST